MTDEPIEPEVPVEETPPPIVPMDGAQIVDGVVVTVSPAHCGGLAGIDQTGEGEFLEFEPGTVAAGMLWDGEELAWPAPPAEDTRSPREKKWKMEKVWRNRLFTQQQQALVLSLQAAAENFKALNARRVTATIMGKPDPLTEDEAEVADNAILGQLAVAFNEDRDALLTELNLSIWSNSIAVFGQLGVFGTDPAVVASEVERVTHGYFPEGSPEAGLPASMVYVTT